MRRIKLWLVRLLLPTISDLPPFAGPDPPLTWSKWFGRCEHKWKFGRYEVVNYRFADAYAEAKADLDEQERRLASHVHIVAGLENDVRYLNQLVDLMTSLDGGLGI